MSNYYQELIGLSVRTRNALISYGLHTREQIENAARLKELRKVPNVGTRAELEIKHWLEHDIKEEAQIVNAIYLLERFGFEVTKKGERRGLLRRQERKDMTKRYIGTKIVTAWKANDKNDVPGYGVIYEDGYQSWSPASAFEPAYRAIEGDNQALTFGDALHMLKLGKRVARAGWNGKEMFVWLQKGSVDSFKPTSKYVNGVDIIHFDAGDMDTVTRMPNINMRAADGSTVVGWLASQTDMLAEDWMVLP